MRPFALRSIVVAVVFLSACISTPAALAQASCGTPDFSTTAQVGGCGGGGLAMQQFHTDLMGCGLPMSSNLRACVVSVTPIGAYSSLNGFRCTTSTATPFFCSAICDCGTVFQGPSTGLPVELMEFSVEPDESAKADAGDTATEEAEAEPESDS